MTRSTMYNNPFHDRESRPGIGQPRAGHLKLRTILLVIAISLLFWVSPVLGGQIKFIKTLTASAPNEQGIFTIIDGAGVATDIDGFASLQDLSPSAFTFTIHLKLADLDFNTETGEFFAVLGPDPAVPHTTEFFLNGSLIAHTSDAVYISTGNVVSNRAQARSFEHLEG